MLFTECTVHGTLLSVFRKVFLSHKTAEIKVFFYFLLVDDTVRIWSRTNDYNFGFGGPIKLTDTMNPDPELWN